MDNEYFEFNLRNNLEKFFKKNENFNILQLIRTKKFLRIIYHGINYSKKHNIILYGKHLNIGKSYDKGYYDIYSRGEKKVFYNIKTRKIVDCKDSETLLTTLGQLNLIRQLLIKGDTLDFFIKNENKFREQLARNETTFKQSYLEFLE